MAPVDESGGLGEHQNAMSVDHADIVLLTEANAGGGLRTLLHPYTANSCPHGIPDNPLRLGGGNDRDDTSYLFRQLRDIRPAGAPVDFTGHGMHGIHLIPFCCQFLEYDIPESLTSTRDADEGNLSLVQEFLDQLLHTSECLAWESA